MSPSPRARSGWYAPRSERSAGPSRGPPELLDRQCEAADRIDEPSHRGRRLRRHGAGLPLPAGLYILPQAFAAAVQAEMAQVEGVVQEEEGSFIVEGSVRKSGNTLRVTAQLMTAEGGVQMWGDRWDRDLDDIFAIQDEISKAIVAALKLTPPDLQAAASARPSRPRSPASGWRRRRSSGTASRAGSWRRAA